MGYLHTCHINIYMHIHIHIFRNHESTPISSIPFHSDKISGCLPHSLFKCPFFQSENSDSQQYQHIYLFA